MAENYGQRLKHTASEKSTGGLQGEAPFDFTCHQLMIGAVWLIILAAFELPGKNGSGHGHGKNYKAHQWSFCVRSIFPGVSILQYFSVPHRFLRTPL